MTASQNAAKSGAFASDAALGGAQERHALLEHARGDGARDRPLQRHGGEHRADHLAGRRPHAQPIERDEMRDRDHEGGDDRQGQDAIRHRAELGEPVRFDRAKTAPAAHGKHPDEFLVAETNQIGVLGVKFVHEPLGGGRLVLRNFLNEGLVIQAVNLLEFPVFGCNFEYQRFLWIHNLVDSGFGIIPRRASSPAISSPILPRCANKIIADKTAISVAVKPARWNHPSANGRQT